MLPKSKINKARPPRKGHFRYLSKVSKSTLLLFTQIKQTLELGVLFLSGVAHAPKGQQC